MKRVEEVGAWARSPEEAVQFLRGEIAASDLAFVSCDMSGVWTKVGEATIEIAETLDEAAVLVKAVENLRAKQSRLRGEAEAECTEIEGRIQRLLAIEDKRPVVEEAPIRPNDIPF